MRLTVLMPMGGLGKRFSDAGYGMPKPLIDVEGRPMFLRALESFPDAWEVDHVFVIRSDQDGRYGLEELIRKACPGARVAVLGHDTRGAAETCLEARGLVDEGRPLVVADCDIRFRSDEYVRKAEGGSFDGLLVGFASSDPRYSYAELDAAGRVVRTAEKYPISEHALLGGYFFGSAARFFDAATAFVSAPLPCGLREYYLSHLFNLLIDAGGAVGFAEADSFDIWGTPEELEAYLERGGRAHA